MRRILVPAVSVLGAVALAAAGTVGLAATAQAASLNVTVSPHSGLSKGDTVTVTGTGFTPGANKAAVVECPANTSLSPTKCDFQPINKHLIKVPSSGKFTTKVTVSDGKIGSAKVDCPCAIVAANIAKLGSVGGDYTKLPHVSKTLSFGNGGKSGNGGGTTGKSGNGGGNGGTTSGNGGGNGGTTSNGASSGATNSGGSATAPSGAPSTGAGGTAGTEDVGLLAGGIGVLVLAGGAVAYRRRQGVRQ